MTCLNECTTIIKLINFNQKDFVSYPIIRLVGLVESSHSRNCLINDDHLELFLENKNLPDANKTPIKLKQGKFKVFLELQEGCNEFVVHDALQSLPITLEYRPVRSEFTVMPLYVICEGHDGFFQAPSNEKNNIDSACKRIQLCSKLLQCFTAEKLLENGLGRRTFFLEETCQIFRSNVNYQEARKMSQEELWETIGRDIMNSELASPNRKYLAFLSCTNYKGDQYSEHLKSHEDLINITEAYVALGGGGLALFGSACLYTWPEHFSEVISRFEDKTLVDKTQFLDDSCYRGTLGACFSTTLGSVLHELYHTFNLGHTETGVMGRGFDNISKFFTLEDQLEVTKSFQNPIEFREEFESDKLSERLSNEYKRKDFHVIKKFEENDWTILTKSCAVILAYHKWFNNFSSSANFTLTFDASNNFIRSTAGIRVVEVRKQPDELILNEWTFEGKVLKYSFRVPDEAFSEKLPIMLFVEDNFGNILKQSVKSLLE
ncbi:uncharacterized protein LOC126742104 [Anthonomus grandis grandis]|uniref:uncharacterized protein LOC126742104 n=1 Tax=Anthonomus grandis grandis TaxID=2921223 RepID=UPI0021655380|nr:uncharacterized protein LOC126742104 [Anthonomus grandis grandis]